jgi:hypothetical protein
MYLDIAIAILVSGTVVDSAFVDIDQVLSHTKYYFTNIIVYKEGLNFLWTEYPIAISSPRHVYPKHEAECQPSIGNIGELGSIKESLCGPVKRNYFQKQVICVALQGRSIRGQNDIEQTAKSKGDWGQSISGVFLSATRFSLKK